MHCYRQTHLCYILVRHREIVFHGVISSHRILQFPCKQNLTIFKHAEQYYLRYKCKDISTDQFQCNLKCKGYAVILHFLSL